MKKRLIVFALSLLPVCLWAYSHDPHQDNVWSKIRYPSAGAPQAIGSYTNGCQLGAQALPKYGTGFISIRRERRRFYSQPVTLALIRRIGHTIAARYQAQILIGDLSLPVGGKMPFGHSSHQNGLDADIWFYTVAANTAVPADIDPPTVVDKRTGKLINTRWQSAYRDALYAAATYPQTNRIFVNPVIKQYLCEQETDTGWLHKIRPWFGHDAHFHVRLNCPPDNRACIRQPAIPPGDGCTSDLQQWVRDQSDAVLHPKPVRPPPAHRRIVPPQTCQQLLNNR